jgi:hypothetical protein
MESSLPEYVVNKKTGRWIIFEEGNNCVLVTFGN